MGTSIQAVLAQPGTGVKGWFATVTHAATGEGFLFTSTRCSKLCNMALHHSALMPSNKLCGETIT